MEKSVKFIKKLNSKKRKILFQVCLDIHNLNLDHLDVKKMQGKKNRFRVRVGKARIIFKKQDDRGVVLGVGSRGDVY